MVYDAVATARPPHHEEFSERYHVGKQTPGKHSGGLGSGLSVGRSVGGAVWSSVVRFLNLVYPRCRADSLPADRRRSDRRPFQPSAETAETASPRPQSHRQTSQRETPPAQLTVSGHATEIVRRKHIRKYDAASEPRPSGSGYWRLFPDGLGHCVTPCVLVG